MKLNPKKCSFGMEMGKFLGVMVTKGGFKANPDKVRAVIGMPSSASVKEVQSLNGRLAALNRLLARYAERSMPFISTLRKCLAKNSIQWITVAERAFQEMTQYLSQLPTLTAPEPGEGLTLYIAATEVAISAVLMVEQNKDLPVYFVSRMLNDLHTR
jgi:hypothetical protein